MCPIIEFLSESCPVSESNDEHSHRHHECCCRPPKNPVGAMVHLKIAMRVIIAASALPATVSANV